MNFLNNWGQAITLAQGATAATLDIPDGSYRLTLADSRTNPTRYEIVDAVVTTGSATLTRAVEATADQDWPEGSFIYCSFTVGMIDLLFSKLSNAELSISNLSQEVASLGTRTGNNETDVTNLVSRMGTAESDLSNLDTRVATAETAITDLDARLTAVEPAPTLNGYVLRWIYSNGDSILTHVSPFAGTMEYAPLDLGYFSTDGATILPDYNGYPAAALNGSGEYVTELGMAQDPSITMFRITFNPNNRYADVTARIELDGAVLGETIFNSGSEGANPSIIEITI